MALHAQSGQSFGLERDDTPPTCFGVSLRRTSSGRDSLWCLSRAFFLFFNSWLCHGNVFILYSPLPFSSVSLSSLDMQSSVRTSATLAFRSADQFLLCRLDRRRPIFYKMNSKKRLPSMTYRLGRPNFILQLTGCVIQPITLMSLQ